MQVVLVYLERFARNSLLKCLLQPKIAKKFTKPPYFGVQGRSRSSMLVPLESSSAVLVIMIRSKSVSICNHSRGRLVDSCRNRTFLRGYPNLMHSYGGLLALRWSSLTPLKSMFNGQHLVIIVLVYLEWFRRNSVLKFVLQPKIAKNSLKPLFWGFKVLQGHRCWYHWKARQQCLL